MTSIRTLAILSVAALSVATSSAHAGGLGGDFLNAVTGTKIGTALDKMNAAAGNPVDHAAATIANAYVPGSGAVIEGYYAYNKGGVNGLIQQQTGISMPTQNGTINGGGYAPQVMPSQQQPMMQSAMIQQPMYGSRCYTQAGFSPYGVAQPLGNFCTAVTPWGILPGSVVQ